MNNQEIATLFRNVAAAYAIKDEKKYKFQIIAYQKAADAVDHASSELKNLYKEGNLEKVPGIGPTIRNRLQELFETGQVSHYEQLLSQISPAVFPLLNIPSFGPKKAYKIVSHFKLSHPSSVIDDVKKLAEEGRIRELESFGEKSEEDILQAIEEYKAGTTKTRRMVLPYAFELAKEILQYLKKNKNIIHSEPLGSLRRMVSTVGDIDIAVTSHNAHEVIDYFVNYPAKERIIEKGPTTASILIGGGRHVDLLVLNPNMWGSLLQHFTGSKHHNVALRECAIKKNYSLSERGIKIKGQDGIKTFKTEEEFYKFIGMDWIPPEMRENLGEIELARKYALPKLVDLRDIKGDLHIHSDYPINSSHDYGSASMEQLLEKAKKLGYEYLGFSEHNPRTSHMVKQQMYEILKKRRDKIDQISESKKYVRIINLLEVDILASGNLALDDKAFEYIDAAIVSIHSVFSTPKDAMTERVLKGLSHPKAKILAHPTGRLLNSRAGYELDWEKIFDYCLKHNKALEINAWPERLDLPDMLVKDAKKQGVKFVIDTDSHALSHMDNMFYGVSVARRGWCEKKDILNAYSYKDFKSWLKL